MSTALIGMLALLSSPWALAETPRPEPLPGDDAAVRAVRQREYAPTRWIGMFARPVAATTRWGRGVF
jgi:hypothetical protein